MPFLTALIAASLAYAQPSPAPSAFASVLARHHLDAARLAELGWVFVDGRCVKRGTDAAIGADELELWLSAFERKPSAQKEKPLVRAVALPKLELASDKAPSSLGTLYDGAKLTPVVDAAPAPRPEAKPATEKTAPDWTERIARDLASPKKRDAALRALAKRFAKDEESEGGLTADAPEALRVLAAAIARGQGGEKAAVELKRELALVAELQPEQKPAFARSLTDPLTVYVALSRSHAPHALDSRLYFARMLELLGSKSLTEFIDEADPRRAHAANFLLRAHAYDVLIPYLNRRAREAAAIAPILFPDDAPQVIASRAEQLEGLLIQLNATGRNSGALEQFVTALERQAKAGGGADAAIAAYLELNEQLLPRRFKPGIEELDPILPDGMLADAGLISEEPYAHWPGDHWRFVLHFASPDAYDSWRERFLARGYVLDSTSGGVALSKTFGVLTVTLEARLYAGNDDDFLEGAEAKRYLADIKRELRDPSVQGVILRNHAQFRVAKLFGKGVTPHKLVLDGACRSAWDLKTLRGRCPRCHFVVNTGTGYGRINNDAVIAVVEGLAAHKSWDDIGAEWSKHAPGASARMQGPWTPDYAAALRALRSASTGKRSDTGAGAR